MPKPPTPELRKYMDKRLLLHLNGGRRINGVLRGYDPFMNLVVEDAYDEGRVGGAPGQGPTAKTSIGMVVVRGNSVLSMEALERI